jgi:integrase
VSPRWFNGLCGSVPLNALVTIKWSGCQIQLCGSNPRLSVIRTVLKEQRYFTPKEMEQLIEAAEGQYKALFALQFATGMRFGEIAGLHVEDLDFSELVVYFRRSTFIHEEVTPKSKAGHREVNVDAGTMVIVKSHLGDRISGRVFESRNGTPLVNGNVNRYVLKPLCKKSEFLSERLMHSDTEEFPYFSRVMFPVI